MYANATGASIDPPTRRSARATRPRASSLFFHGIRRLVSIAVVYTLSCWPVLAAPSGEAPDRILPGEAIAADIEREPIHGQLEGLLAIPSRTTPAKDPRNGAEFAASVHVYLSENGTMVRRFVVHAPDRDALPIARRCGRMLAWLYAAARSRVGAAARGLRGAPVHVWMTRSGEAGGEQIRNNLYFYGLFDDRTGLEWVREIAHEYGHYLLPGASGYSQPESWANGVLGERLFIKWILEDLQAGTAGSDALPFGTRAELEEYRARQIAPLLARMQVDGPDSASLAATDRTAFDNFTALLLYADDTYGSRILMDMLDYLPPNGNRALHGDDFLNALMLCLDHADTLEVRLAADEASRVYLPKGSFHVSSPTPLLFGKDLPVSATADGWQVRVPGPAWRTLRTAPAAGFVRTHWERSPSTGAGANTP